MFIAQYLVVGGMPKSAITVTTNWQNRVMGVASVQIPIVSRKRIAQLLLNLFGRAAMVVLAVRAGSHKNVPHSLNIKTLSA